MIISTHTPPAICVSFFVTWFAKRSAIVYVESKFVKLAKSFYVVCVKFAAALSTVLTGVVIPSKYGASPFFIFLGVPYFLVNRRNAAAPIAVSGPSNALGCKVVGVWNASLFNNLCPSETRSLFYYFWLVFGYSLSAIRTISKPIFKAVSSFFPLLLARGAGNRRISSVLYLHTGIIAKNTDGTAWNIVRNN